MKANANLPLLICFILLFHNANAFNITQILTQYPDFGSLNDYLTQTGLAGQINSRETITILAVENATLTPLSDKPPQVLANILSVHVVLDYFDIPKLQKLPEGPTTLTTLFQTTGLARGQQGFVNVTRLTTGTVAFGSAVAGSAPAVSNVIKSIFSQPYNISVLHVSSVIIPPGVDGGTPPSSGGASSPAAPSGPHTPTMAPSAGPGGGGNGAHQPPAGAPSLPGGGSHAPSEAPSSEPGAAGGGWAGGPTASPRASPPAAGEGPTPSGVAPEPGIVTPPVAGPVGEAGPAASPVADAAMMADGPAAGEVPASNTPSMGPGLGVVWVVVGCALGLALAI